MRRKRVRQLARYHGPTGAAVSAPTHTTFGGGAGWKQTLAACTARAWDPISGASLAWFRALFGLLLAGELAIYLRSGWVDSHWISPTFHFKFYGFTWVQPWLGSYLTYFVVTLIVATLLVAIGAGYRYASWYLGLGFTYLFLLDQAVYLNHFYLIVLLCCLFVMVPTHVDWSVDAWRRRRRATDAATPLVAQVPAYHLGLFRFTIGLPYFFGGLAKINADWLRGEPVRTWLAERDQTPLVGDYFHAEPTVALFVWGGLLFDLLIVPMLLWRPTRSIGCCLVLAFHLTNAILFDIGIFPWLMLAATTLFFPPDWPDQVIAGCQKWFWPRDGRSRRNLLEASRVVGARPAMVPASRWHYTLAGLFVAVQLVIPFRHWLYPGNVSWTKEGHRFAWHMMLNRYEGRGQFFVTDPRDDALHEVDPLEELSRKQWEVMLINPDMLLQFAHHLADRFQAEHQVRPAVSVRVAISLDGRRPQWLIDPSVDLAAQPRSLLPAPWIVPLRYSLDERMAAGDWDRLLPPTALQLHRLAEMHAADGRQEVARDHWRRAVQIDPNYVPARWHWGRELLQQGPSAEALTHLQAAWEARQAWPKQLDLDALQLALANAYAAVGRPADAIPLLIELTQRTPQRTEAHYNLGNAYLATADYRAAIEAYQTTLQFRHEFAEAHCNLGAAWHALGDTPQAITCYQQALRCDPQLADAHNNLAVALMGLARWEEAASHLRQVLQIRPGNQAAQANLEEVQRHLP